jgi:hypothetical protein
MIFGIFVLVLTSAITGLMAVPANANGPDLVVNGGFESPTVADPALWHRYETSELGSSWTVEWYPSDAHPAEVPVMEIQDGVCGPAYAGQQFAELDSNHPTSIYQNLNTVAGTNYVLTFAFSPRPGTVTEDNHLLVQWDNNPVVDLTADGSGLQTTSWTLYTYPVHATGDITTLRFTNSGANPKDSYGTFLDNVSVTEFTPDAPLPELPAGVLLGIGLFGVGGFVLIKRRVQGAAVK